jgi:hypothetical protein
VLGAIEVKLSHMSVWWDIQEQAGLQRRRRQWLQSRVLGLDGAYVRCGGKTRPVLVAVDLGRGEPVALGYVVDLVALDVEELVPAGFGVVVIPVSGSLEASMINARPEMIPCSTRRRTNRTKARKKGSSPKPLLRRP